MSTTKELIWKLSMLTFVSRGGVHPHLLLCELEPGGLIQYTVRALVNERGLVEKQSFILFKLVFNVQRVISSLKSCPPRVKKSTLCLYFLKFRIGY